MRSDPQGGVICLVTAEVQGEGVLIRVKTSEGSDRFRQDTEQSYVDADEALAAVASFLHSFTDAIAPPDQRPPGQVG